MVTMAQLAQQVDWLTTDHLATVLRGLAASPPPVTVDDDFFKFGLATEVLRFFFGDRWTNENVFIDHKEVSSHHHKGRQFLNTDATDSDARLRHQQRVLT